MTDLVPRLGLLSWVLLAAFAAACGGDDDNDDNERTADSTGGPTGPSDEANFRSQFGALACASLETCCREAGFGYNPTICMAFISPAPNTNPAVTFDPMAAGECLNQLQNAELSCSDGTDTPPCDRVYIGSKAPGEPCSDDAECALPENGQRECDLSDSVCIAKVRGVEGQPCQMSCEETNGGYLCLGAGLDDGGFERVECWREDGLSCSSGVCTSLGGPGATCSGDRDCSADAYCEGFAACAPRVALGASCTTSGECVTDAYCDTTCEPKGAEGAGCTLDEQCVSENCEGGSCGPGVGDSLAGAFLGLFCGG